MATAEDRLPGDSRARADERRELLVDVALSLVACVGLVVTAITIGAELTGRTGHSLPRAVSVARVERADGNVKRRGADDLVWDLVEVGDGIGRGDGLFVPADAMADIVFDDGSVLTVAPSSLVVIDSSEPHGSAPPSVDLRQGGLVVSPAGGGLEVRSGGTRTTVAAAAVASVTLEGGGGARLDVSRGEATITGPGGGSLRLRDAGAAVASASAVRRLDSRAVLVSPAAGARSFFGGARGAVTFEWRSTVRDVVLELADDRAFTRVLLGRPASRGSMEVGDLAPGAYFWRVRAPDGSWASEGRPLLVVRDLPPETISPASGQLVYAPGGAATTFRWSAVPGVRHYLLQIASDPSFAVRVAEREVSATRVRLAAFAPEGVYRWRVRALERQRGVSPFSSPAAFRLVLEPLPAAPELFDPQLELEAARPTAPPGFVPRGAPAGSPAPARVPPATPAATSPPAPGHPPASDAHSGEYRSRARQGVLAWLWHLAGGVAAAAEPPPGPAAAPPAAPLAVLLRWSAVPGVVGYDLEIAEDADFHHVSIRERIDQPYFRWHPPSSATFWWRVRSIDARGREGLFSAARPVSPMPAPPELISPADAARFAHARAVELAWSPQQLAQGYSIEVARDRELRTALVRLTSTGPRATLPPQAPGTYWWRVRALDATGAEGPASTMRRLTFDPEPPEPEPPGEVDLVTVAPTARVSRAELLEPALAPLAAPETAPRPDGSLLGVGLRVGGALALVRAGREARPSGVLEVSYPLESLVSGLEAVARVSYHHQRVSADGPLAASATQEAVPLVAGARLSLAVPRVTPYLTTGLVVGVLHAEQRAEGQPSISATRIALGIEGGAGIETRVGVGTLFVEARYGWLRAGAAGMSMNGGGLGAGIGYRLWL